MPVNLRHDWIRLSGCSPTKRLVLLALWGRGQLIKPCFDSQWLYLSGLHLSPSRQDPVVQDELDDAHRFRRLLADARILLQLMLAPVLRQLSERGTRTDRPV